MDIPEPSTGRAFGTIVAVSTVGGLAVGGAFGIVLDGLSRIGDARPQGVLAGLGAAAAVGAIFGVFSGFGAGLLNGVVIAGLLASGMAPERRRRAFRFAAPAVTAGTVALVSFVGFHDASLEVEGWLLLVLLPALVAAGAAELALARVPPLRRLVA